VNSFLMNSFLILVRTGVGRTPGPAEKLYTLPINKSPLKFFSNRKMLLKYYQLDILLF